MALHSLSDLPEPLQHGHAVVGLHVEVLLVGDKLPDHAAGAVRHAAVDKLVEERHHLGADHGAALQKNLADRQNLAVGQAPRHGAGQTVSPLVPVVDHVLGQLLLHEKAAQSADIPLDAALRNAEFLRQFRLLQHAAGE